MWRNFQFPHNCHTWKAEISPRAIFYSTNNISDISDKYQVCFVTLDVQLCILTRQNFILHRGSEVAPLAETLSIRI